MTAVDRDVVKQNLLIEGLMDAISLGEVHGSFVGRDAGGRQPIPVIQEQTLDMIRELVSEGFFILGIPTRSGDFEAWNLPLDAAIARIEDAYVGTFEDRWSWTTMVWLNQTENGKKRALQLYDADGADPTDR